MPLVVGFSIAKLADYDPLATLQIILEFGHDTDSYAQLMGAYFGALHGPGIFPDEMRDSIDQRLKEQFGESVEEWVKLLLE